MSQCALRKRPGCSIESARSSTSIVEVVEALGDSRYAAPPIIETNMREGRIGMKTGQGFMNYEGVDQAAYREQRLAAFASALRAMGLAREPVA